MYWRLSAEDASPRLDALRLGDGLFDFSQLALHQGTSGGVRRSASRRCSNESRMESAHLVRRVHDRRLCGDTRRGRDRHDRGRPDGGEYKLQVHPVVEKACGKTDYHGKAPRGLRIYGATALRLPGATGPTTQEEIEATFRSIEGLRPKS